MVTPFDEASLTAGLASVQSTLAEHSRRFDRVESSLAEQGITTSGKLDKVIDRIDVLYPQLATLTQRVTDHDRQLLQIEKQQEALRGLLLKIAGVTAVTVIALIGDAVWSGLIKF